MDTQVPHLPHVRPRAHDKYLRLIDAAQRLPAVVTAVAHPCDEASLSGAVEAWRLGLLDPILVGPPTRLRDVAAPVAGRANVLVVPDLEAAICSPRACRSWPA